MATRSFRSLASIVVELRRHRGMSQEDVEDTSYRLGCQISARTISDIERGLDRRPHTSTLDSLITIFDLAGEDADELRRAAQGKDGRSHRPLAAAFASALPLPLTKLIGRESDLAKLCDLVGDNEVRLMTLSGPGGIGKTRLAIALAQRLTRKPGYPVWFVPLEAVPTPDLIGSALGQAIGVPDANNATIAQRMQATLQDRSGLLILDAFEHLVMAAALVGEVLASCPGLVIVATSRIALRLAGEHEYVVQPLALPPDEPMISPKSIAAADAVRLFTDRARSQNLHWQPSAEEMLAIAAICRQLDGLPLAIELAAARSRLLPPRTLLARIDTRLPLLTDAVRDSAARHRTMREAISWSYDLLNPADQSLFRWLSVFADTWSIEAAEEVCASLGDSSLSVLDGLASLQNQSLIFRRDTADGSMRLAMYGVIREFAREQLAAHGEAATVRTSHAAYYQNIAAQAEALLTDVHQSAELEFLTSEHGNLLAALEWIWGNANVEACLELAGGLWRFWLMRGLFSEGRTWLERALELQHDNIPPQTRISALTGAGVLAERQGDYAHAERRLQERLELAKAHGSRSEVAVAHMHLGIVTESKGDLAAALVEIGQAISAFREIGDDLGVANALSNLGNVLRKQGELTRAATIFDEQITLRRRIGDVHGLGAALSNRGVVAAENGQYTDAASFFEESLAIRRRLQDEHGIASVTANLGAIALAQGDEEGANRHLQQYLHLSQRLGDQTGVAIALLDLGEVEIARGVPDQAQTYFQQSFDTAEAIENRRIMAKARHGLGVAATLRGDVDRATAQLNQSLRLSQETEDAVGIVDSLEAIAVILADSEPNRALELLAFSAHYRAASRIVVPAHAARRAHVAWQRCLELLGESAGESVTLGERLTIGSATSLITQGSETHKKSERQP